MCLAGFQCDAERNVLRNRTLVLLRPSSSRNRRFTPLEISRCFRGKNAISRPLQQRNSRGSGKKKQKQNHTKYVPFSRNFRGTSGEPSGNLRGPSGNLGEPSGNLRGTFGDLRRTFGDDFGFFDLRQTFPPKLRKLNCRQKISFVSIPEGVLDKCAQSVNSKFALFFSQMSILGAAA